MKKIIFIIFIIIVILNVKSREKYIEIPEEAIRYRIIPNSNTALDQFEKNYIQKSVEENLLNLVDKNSLEQTKDNILNNVDNIKKIAEGASEEINYKEEIKVKYGKNYFPQKTFKNKIYEEGYYESLVIEIGEAKGDNFWCVLFPPLCMLENEQTSDEIEYKSFINEIIEKLFK